MKKPSPINKVYFEKLAKFVYDTVINEGGDGGGLILCRHHNYFEVADVLEEFFKTQTAFKEKIDGLANEVTFSDNQESITIAQHNVFYLKNLEFYIIRPIGSLKNDLGGN